MTNNLFFITGTDTAVGKTVVSSGLVARLKQEGFDVRAIKPVESGCTEVKGELHPVDAATLAAAAGHLIDCPIRFRAPLAPSAAAVLEPERSKVDLMKAAAHLQAAARSHEIVIAEGAGGLLVPLSAETLIADLVFESSARLVVVGRGGLGTINHTALTLEVAKRRNLRIAGFVLSIQDKTSRHRVSENAQAIQQITNADFLGIVPFQGDTSPSKVATEIPNKLLSAIRPATATVPRLP